MVELGDVASQTSISNWCEDNSLDLRQAKYYKFHGLFKILDEGFLGSNLGGGRCSMFHSLHLIVSNSITQEILRIRKEIMIDQLGIWYLASFEHFSLEMAENHQTADTENVWADYSTILETGRKWERSGMLQPGNRLCLDCSSSQCFPFPQSLLSCRASAIRKIFLRKVWVLWLRLNPCTILIWGNPSYWRVALWATFYLLCCWESN